MAISRIRLLGLYIHIGTDIHVLRQSPLNDPIEYQVGDFFISLRKKEAEKIEVEETILFQEGI